MAWQTIILLRNNWQLIGVWLIVTFERRSPYMPIVYRDLKQHRSCLVEVFTNLKGPYYTALQSQPISARACGREVNRDSIP